MLVISSSWKIVNFKKTHLIQRMGLLTLIVMGEGIIGLSRTVNQVIQGYGWTTATTGQAISAVLAVVSDLKHDGQKPTFGLSLLYVVHTFYAVF